MTKRRRKKAMKHWLRPIVRKAFKDCEKSMRRYFAEVFERMEAKA